MLPEATLSSKERATDGHTSARATVVSQTRSRHGQMSREPTVGHQQGHRNRIARADGWLQGRLLSLRSTDGHDAAAVPGLDALRVAAAPGRLLPRHPADRAPPPWRLTQRSRASQPKVEMIGLAACRTLPLRGVATTRPTTLASARATIGRSAT